MASKEEAIKTFQSKQITLTENCATCDDCPDLGSCFLVYNDGYGRVSVVDLPSVVNQTNRETGEQFQVLTKPAMKIPKNVPDHLVGSYIGNRTPRYLEAPLARGTVLLNLENEDQRRERKKQKLDFLEEDAMLWKGFKKDWSLGNHYTFPRTFKVQVLTFFLCLHKLQTKAILPVVPSDVRQTIVLTLSCLTKTHHERVKQSQRMSSSASNVSIPGLNTRE